MVQIKKYRAATTREALEQVKRELGEDAFVLEAKRVRTNGFFGFGSVSQIEISAAAASISNAASTELLQQKQNSSPVQTNRKLNLFDDTPAVPITSRPLPRRSDNQQAKLAASLSARADSEELELKPDAPLSAKTYFSEKTTSQTNAASRVEIANHAPRVVHAKKESLASPNSATPASFTKTSENPQSQAATQFSKNDFERLRAEVREIKFSLAAFATHQTSEQNRRDGATLSEARENLPTVYLEAYNELVKTGVQSEIAQILIEEEISKNQSSTAKPSEIAYSCLLNNLSSLIKFSQDPLYNEKPAILALIGATGVGKTTTIAKLAARIATREQRRVELVTLDTYRIAAVEQLKTYAEIIGAGCHIVRSTNELETTLDRLPSDASVLIDTTGRNPHDLADQIEISNFLRERTDILKCLVMQATMHPLDAIMAGKKFEIYGTNCLALTKLDETTRPGSILEIAAETALPLIYFCTGQRVPEDLTVATPETIASRILPLQSKSKSQAKNN